MPSLTRRRRSIIGAGFIVLMCLPAGTLVYYINREPLPVRAHRQIATV